MKFSIFTPTHDTRYLLEAYKSLDAQTVGDWEWIVVPNGAAIVPDEIRDDPRVVIRPAPAGVDPGVGFLKGFACGAATGELLVELDHDDLLTPFALDRIAKARDKTGADFLYSDFVAFNAPGSANNSTTYPASAGWVSYPFRWRDETYTAMSAFEPEPASLCSLSFAPNHVRVWSRDAYTAIGGHDTSLPVCDDHDLVCRTYIGGYEFHHIRECLYLYRERDAEGDQNTYREQAGRLASVRMPVANKYFYRLIEEWCRRTGLRKIDIGRADQCPDGYESMPARHWADERRITMYAKLQIQDGQVGVIRAFDALPYIPQDRIVEFWNWSYDALAPGGWVNTRTMSTEGRGAFERPDAQSYWNPNSFLYVSQAKYRETVAGLKAKFQVNRQWDDKPTEWHDRMRVAYCNADLVALKGQRAPGPVHV